MGTIAITTLNHPPKRKKRKCQGHDHYFDGVLFSFSFLFLKRFSSFSFLTRGISYASKKEKHCEVLDHDAHKKGKKEKRSKQCIEKRQFAKFGVSGSPKTSRPREHPAA